MHVEVRGVALLLPPFLWNLRVSLGCSPRLAEQAHLPPSISPAPAVPAVVLKCVSISMLSLTWQNSGRTQPSKLEVHFLEISGLNMKLMKLLEAQSPAVSGNLAVSISVYCPVICFAKCRSVSSVLAWCHPFTGHNPVR